MYNTRGGHLHTSSVCTWCEDQNVIKGSRTEILDSQRIKNEIQDDQAIKNEMIRPSSDQDREIVVKTWVSLLLIVLIIHSLCTIANHI